MVAFLAGIFAVTIFAVSFNTGISAWVHQDTVLYFQLLLPAGWQCKLRCVDA
jgi:hypothetical protein